LQEARLAALQEVARLLREPCSHRRVLVLADDTAHLRSMQQELFRVARDGPHSRPTNRRRG